MTGGQTRSVGPGEGDQRLDRWLWFARIVKSRTLAQKLVLSGAVRVDGTRVQLDIGAKIYENDVLITDGGGKMSVTFADGTIFTLAANSRMVIDDLVYDPDASEGNGGAFSLVEEDLALVDYLTQAEPKVADMLRTLIDRAEAEEVAP